MIRILIFALLIYIGYRMFLKMTAPSSDAELDDASEAEFIQDPQCGAYFMKQRGATAVINGKTVYFCSDACRDKYLIENRRQ